MTTAVWRVLVADDDPTVGLLMSAALPKDEFVLSVVTDGLQALAVLQENDFDLVLLDVEMPGASGVEVCTALRRMDEGCVPVLFLTGRGDAQFFEEVRGLNADCICKPIDWGQLAASLRATLAVQSGKAGRA
jgi:DNA-binding response OmpR family regulator